MAAPVHFSTRCGDGHRGDVCRTSAWTTKRSVQGASGKGLEFARAIPPQAKLARAIANWAGGRGLRDASLSRNGPLGFASAANARRAGAATTAAGTKSRLIPCPVIGTIFADRDQVLGCCRHARIGRGGNQHNTRKDERHARPLPNRQPFGQGRMRVRRKDNQRKAATHHYGIGQTDF